MYALIRRALFSLPPEAAHAVTLESLRLGHSLGATGKRGEIPSLPVEAMGLNFPNPVGLAAGMDKDGEAIDALGGLGFGFVEIGTTTPRPQPGNPPPRVFRLPRQRALINRLGFNNKGVDHLVERAAKRRYSGILGINIGKNFDTPVGRAEDDYVGGLRKVYTLADYVAVNISSPNTQGLRSLQERAPLKRLLSVLGNERERLADRHGRYVPLAVKVAPDLDDSAIPELASIIAEAGFDGVIATNTTVERPGVAGRRHADEDGGLSGAPLRERADAVLARFREALPRDVALIGTGGILTGEDARRKIELGADLVQFYTGLVYRGPRLIGECIDALAAAKAAA